MRPSQVAQSLDYLITARQPVMLHGSPGVGKSQVVAQVAKKRGIQMLDVRLSQLDPVDLRGVPSVDPVAKITTWNTPDFLPREGSGILFLDEINSAAQATQAAAYQLVLDRKLGNYTLPDSWSIVAAGNRSKDRAIVNQMSTALKNRLVHIDFEVHNDDWVDWALSNDIDIAVLSYIRFRPTMLNEFDLKEDSAENKKRVQRIKDSNGFATPRSWEFVSRIMKQSPPGEILYELLVGTVGEHAAADFKGYLKVYHDLPDLDAILMDPKKSPVPTDIGAKYAVATGIAAKVTVDNFERAMQYAERLPKDFQVLLVKDAMNRTKQIIGTKTLTSWIAKNKEILA